MFIAIYICLLFATLILGNQIYKTLLNPITIWASFWSLIGVMSNMALFEYYVPSDFVNAVIITGIIVYTGYCALAGITRKGLYTRRTFSDEIFNNLQIKIFWIINILAICYEVPFLFRAIRVLMSHGFQLVYLRGVLTDATEGIVSGGLTSIIRDSGVKNVFTLTALYAAVLIFTNANKRIKRKVIILAVIETIEYCVSNAARAYIINFLFFILFALLFMKRDSIMTTIRKNKKVVMLFGVLIIAVLIIQNSRASDMSILKTIYMYYCSGPSYLTQLLADGPAAIQVGSNYYMGTITLGFLSNIFYYLKIGLTGINDSTVKLVASTITIKQYFVGAHTYLNAMCTCFYAFLADWGIVGSVLGPIVCGFLTCRYYKKMKLKNSLGSVAICVYMFYLMFRTVFKWELLYIDFSVILILNYFICPNPGQRFVIGKPVWENLNEE